MSESDHKNDSTVAEAALDETVEEIIKQAQKPDKKADDHTGKDAKHERPIIIIKRIKKVHGKHHGGSWKIAYADFVTAMMTFFLLMWLLSMLNKYQREGISDYFKRPIKTVIAQKTDPKNDMIKSEDTTTTNVTAKLEKVDQASKIKETPKEAENRAASERIKADLEKQLEANPKISQYKNMLNFKVTSQGLKIELRDLDNKPMFSSGKTDFAQYASTIINWLSSVINKYPNRVMILGHTDSKPIQGSLNYTNWELSADRANATRRELIKHGMLPEKIVRVVGAADIEKLNTAQTTDDPANRRIEIVILNDDIFQKMQSE